MTTPTNPASDPLSKSESGSATATAVVEPVTAAESPLLEKIFALASLAVGAAILIGGRAIELRNETDEIDARFWPTLVGGGIILSALWTTFNAFTGRRAERDVEPATREGWGRLLATVVLTAVVLAIWYAGVSFLILAPLYLMALNYVFGLRNIKSLIVFPAIISGALYLIFHLLLKVPL